jgi:intracellular sulfur oxidation DsrE/DsrF family protein
MIMRKSLSLMLMVLFWLPAFESKAQTARRPEHRIVMQLTSGDTTSYNGLMKQLRNLTTGWGDSVQIEVVCHGPGLNLLLTAKTQHSEKIYAFQKQGIRFVACENTLRERNIRKEEVLPGMDYVPMGIAEIVIKQEQGWSYIKAGN